MSKLTLLTAAAAGYVLGARAGRERYEQIAAGARKVGGQPPRPGGEATGPGRRRREGHPGSRTSPPRRRRETASSVESPTVSDKVHRTDGGTHAAHPPHSAPSDPSWPTDSGAPQAMIAERRLRSADDPRGGRMWA